MADYTGLENLMALLPETLAAMRREAEVLSLMPQEMRDRVGAGSLIVQYIAECDLIAEHHIHRFYQGPSEIIRCSHKYGDGIGCPMTTVVYNTLPSWEVRVYRRAGSVFDATREVSRPTAAEEK